MIEVTKFAAYSLTISETRQPLLPFFEYHKIVIRFLLNPGAFLVGVLFEIGEKLPNSQEYQDETLVRLRGEGFAHDLLLTLLLMYIIMETSIFKDHVQSLLIKI